MPEYSDLSIPTGGFYSSFYCLSYGKVLVISCQDLCRAFLFVREAGEVLYDVQKPFLREYALEESIIVSILRTFVVAVLGLPFHEAVFVAGDGTSLRAHHVAHHTEGIVCEHRWNLVHVVPQLPVCSGSISLLT